jgi:hypothetical protein
VVVITHFEESDHLECRGLGSLRMKAGEHQHPVSQ